ncbi:MAG: hypothetical protein J0H55_16555 [Chitinophagaceae bacterium]|nr:hypothetical protein [Chitinophagaceae bacterium]
MKPLHFGTALLFLLIITLSATAQNHGAERQPIFKNSADRLPTAITELDKAFNLKEGTSVSFKFYNMAFSGTVVSAADKHGRIKSVVIESSSLKNTILSLSKITNDDKTITYTGRILNQGASDGYELTKNQDGTYTFHKIRTDDLIQDY